MPRFARVITILSLTLLAAVTQPGRANASPQAPSSAPAACQVDWSHSGPLSYKCANAALAQANTERQAGNCAAAVADYELARAAGQNAGAGIIMTLMSNDGYNDCKHKLHPAAKPRAARSQSSVRYGREGLVPNGHYTCYSYASVISAGPINTSVALGQRVGDVWIYSNTKYANGSYNYYGHYSMRGNRIVASDGPFRKNDVIAYYQPNGLYHRRTIMMGYADGHGGTIANSACTYDGK